MLYDLEKTSDSKDRLRSVFKKRDGRYDYETVRGGNQEALQSRIDGHLAEGWELSKRRARSAVMRRAKSEARQFEDDVWCLMYRLGFKEMSLDDQFRFNVGEDVADRQFDVFAQDDDTAFVIECTTRQPGAKNDRKDVRVLIEKIEALRSAISRGFQSPSGGGKPRRVKFAVAVRGVPTEANRAFAADRGIAIIEDEDIQYFSALANHLREAARFQFLATYLRDQGVPGVATKVAAIRGKVGPTVFYSFLISPHALLKHAFVSHLRNRTNEALDTYQRMVQSNRLARIARYIDGGGTFPTNIVVNFRRQSDRPLRFEPLRKDEADIDGVGTLHLPGRFGSAFVIDGQHRLYAFTRTRRDEHEDRSMVSVLAYDGLSAVDEIKQFLDINSQQKKVETSLVKTLLANLDVDAEAPGARLEAWAASVAIRLAEDRGSPLHGRVPAVSQKAVGVSRISIVTLTAAVSKGKLLGTVIDKRRRLDPGPLASEDGDARKSITKATQVLERYLRLVADASPSQYGEADAKRAFLFTNVGIRALIRLLSTALDVARNTRGLEARRATPDQIIEAVRTSATAVGHHFETASEADLQRFKNFGSSEGAVTRSYQTFMDIVTRRDASFTTPEHAAYVAQRDEQGTRQARLVLENSIVALRDNVRTVLEEVHGVGDAGWWRLGVPKSVRTRVLKAHDDSDGTQDRWSFVTYADIASIVGTAENWEQFRDRYNLRGEKTKSKGLAWLKSLGAHARALSVPDAEPLNHTDAQFVVHAGHLIERHVVGGEATSVGVDRFAELDVEELERPDAA